MRIIQNNLNFTLELDSSDLERELESAFKDTMFVLGNKFTQAITLPQWDWINPPTPRDIVDTGRLRASQQLNFLNKFLAEFIWNTDYALYVHEGATLRNGTQTPPRRWTEKALNTFDVKQAIERLIQNR